MTRDVGRADLYRGVINLWVEDRLTRDYLSIIWRGDPSVGFLVAGGNDGVGAVVRDAEQNGFLNVFGLVDGDTRPSNRKDWQSPAKTFRTFVLPVHEIENYLLDPDSLEAVRLNTLKKSASELEGILNQQAARLSWWAAARDVTRELKSRFRENFMGQPAFELADRDAALRHILDSTWYRNLPSHVAQSSEPNVELLLDQARGCALRQIQDGSWRREFAGKEIFRHVGSRIHDGGRDQSKTEFDIDLAKEVADAQIRLCRVPPDLMALRAALGDRIARATRTAP